jgi:hypothetical protein
MNLILFPESASLKNGYGIAVDYAYNKLNPNNNDLIIWYTNDKDLPKYKESDIILRRPRLFSFKRLKNMLFNRLGAEVTTKDLHDIKAISFENIYCDDVIFYRAIRKLFPEKFITVRFHNCFSRIKNRKNILKIRENVMFEIKLLEYQKLEREIFRDKNTHKIFISEEDRAYYKLLMGRTDSSVWSFKLDENKAYQNRTEVLFDNKIVWFGGLQDHKMSSIYWFINEVLPKIKLEIPNIEFHLWGMNTIKLNSPKNNIFGHGYYTGKGFPFKETALYINPDIIGGGVKLKLKTYYEEGLIFITTPFGFEGYSLDLVDNKYVMVEDLDSWSEVIISTLQTSSSIPSKHMVYEK